MYGAGQVATEWLFSVPDHVLERHLSSDPSTPTAGGDDSAEDHRISAPRRVPLQVRLTPRSSSFLATPLHSTASQLANTLGLWHYALIRSLSLRPLLCPWSSRLCVWAYLLIIMTHTDRFDMRGLPSLCSILRLSVIKHVLT